MIKVFLKKEPDEIVPAIHFYIKGESHYVQERWLYILDEEGHILGFHPEVNVAAVHVNEGGRIGMSRVDPDRSGEERKIP